MVELVLLVLSLLLSPMLAWLAARKFRSWKGWRVVLLGALPLPLLVLSFGVVGFMANLTMSLGACEPAVCNLALGLGLLGVIMAPIMYAVSVPLAGLGLFLARKASARDMENTFR